MNQYVDGFVLQVKKNRVNEYQKMAEHGGNVWMKHGALLYIEAMGDDVFSAEKWGCWTFPKMAKTKKDEVVFFSFIIYKSKAHRDQVNKKVMADPSMNEYKDKPMPFDMKRMAVGGFKTIVNKKK